MTSSHKTLRASVKTAIALLITLSMAAFAARRSIAVLPCIGDFDPKGLNTTNTIQKTQTKCYGNKTQNCDKYGRLYDWNTAMKACPAGWHLPSGTDWNVLMKFVNPSCSDNKSCDGTGIKLKAKSGWKDDRGKSGNGTSEPRYPRLKDLQDIHICLQSGKSSNYMNHGILRATNTIQEDF
ncbi:MAG: hypothetical protein LBH25_09995 [Fibromonadaceae bacterium]|jgi:hypothetical protein|nr:hypothetical protein [Fibromonadaceae bacterium]